MVLNMQYPALPPTEQTSSALLKLRSWLGRKGAPTRILLSTVGIGIGVLLLFQLFSRIDFKDVPAQLEAVGIIGFALALLPYSAIALFDTSGWRRLLPERIAFHRIFNIRAATEALVITAPMGSVLSDPAKAWMLKRSTNMPVSQTTASIVLRKFLLMFGQGFVALAIAVAAWLFPVALEVHDLPAGLLTVLVSVGLGMSLLGSLLISLVSGAALLRKAQKHVLKIKFAKLQSWMISQEARLEELHKDFERLGAEGLKDVIVASLEYVALWVLELFETYVILRVLGVDISFAQAGVIEAACTLARAAAFMVPGGIGVQDTGYATLLIASGVRSPSVAAFLLLKRLREALWALLGFSLLFVERSAFRRSVLINSTQK